MVRFTISTTISAPHWHDETLECQCRCAKAAAPSNALLIRSGHNFELVLLEVVEPFFAADLSR